MNTTSQQQNPLPGNAISGAQVIDHMNAHLKKAGRRIRTVKIQSSRIIGDEIILDIEASRSQVMAARYKSASQSSANLIGLYVATDTSKPLDCINAENCSPIKVTINKDSIVRSSIDSLVDHLSDKLMRTCNDANLLIALQDQVHNSRLKSEVGDWVVR